MEDKVSGRATMFKNDCKIRRKIHTIEDFELFKSSKCSNEILKFIQDMANSVIGLTLREDIACSTVVNKLYNMLEVFDLLVSEYPPIEQKESRFGNKVFREWHKRISTDCKTLLAEFVPVGTVREIRGYLITSFGHPGRIDYGTGHELNFILVLLCLSKLGLLRYEDYPAVVLKVFCRYVTLMRKLFVEYWLEPAGSQGVWGLDDYCFLPFLFGAAQLYNHKYLRPKSILNEEYLDEFGDDYMYFCSVKFINSVKTAPFEICSPLLYDISSVKTWEKVYNGMIKMYKNQVLEKLPVIQHLRFGSIINFKNSSTDDYISDEAASSDDFYSETAHSHSTIKDGAQSLPDCCGIRIPSSAAASADAQKRGSTNNNSRLHFIPSD